MHADIFNEGSETLFKRYRADFFSGVSLLLEKSGKEAEADGGYLTSFGKGLDTFFGQS